MRSRPAVHPRLAVLALALSLVALGSCGKSSTKPVVPADPAPTPDTPRHAVDLFRWSWGHKSLERFRELFTDDFLFTAYYRDSATMADTSYARDRAAIIDSVAGVFALPVTIRLDYLAIDPTVPDPRPGKDPGWHSRINVRFNLSITTLAGGYIAHPVEEFYLVRGDSAQIPNELVLRGFVPDSTRWYISDWIDYTAVTAPTAGATAAEDDRSSLFARPRATGRAFGWQSPASYRINRARSSSAGR